jgi:hypothetical protein
MALKVFFNFNHVSRCVVVLHGFSLCLFMINGIEHLLVYLLLMYTFSLMK